MPLSTRTDDNRIIDEEKLRLLYSAATPAVAISIGVATMLVAILWDVIPTQTLLFWLGMQYIVSIIRIFIAQFYLSLGNSKHSNIRWKMVFDIGVLTAGVVWGSAAIFLLAEQDPFYQSITIITLAGVSAGSIISMAASWYTTSLFVVPLVLPIAIRIGILHPETGISLAAMFCLYIIFLLSISRRISINLASNIQLRLDMGNREKESRLQHEWYQNLVESTSAIVWEGNANTNEITFVNQHAQTILGYTVDTWKSGENFQLEHVHPSDRSKLLESQGKIRNGENTTLDYRLIAQDGKTLWFKEAVRVYPEANNASVANGVMLDITNSKTIESELEYLSEMQEAIVSVSQCLIYASPDEIDDAVLEALRIIGECCQVDRSYVFRFRDNGEFSDNTHEWCRKGIPATIHLSQNLPRSGMPNVRKIIELKEVLHINSVADLDDSWNVDAALLKEQEIAALVVAPILIAGNLYGHIGFDSVITEKTWTAEEIRTIQVLGELIGAAIDQVTSRKALMESEALRANAEELAHLGSWHLDLIEDRFKPSNQWRQVTGCFDTQLNAEKVLKLCHPDDLLLLQTTLDQSLHNNKTFDIEHRIVRHNDNEVRWIRVHAEVGREDSIATHLQGFAQDITERKLAEVAMIESEKRYRNVVNNINEVVFQLNKKREFEFLNPAWKEILGYNVQETLGQCIDNFSTPEALGHLQKETGKLNYKHNSNTPIETQFRTASGEIRDVEIRLRLLGNAHSDTTGFTGTLQDVTKRNESEKRIRFLAQYDPLTSLPNRALAFARLEKLIEKATTQSQNLAIIYVDLDNFKSVNDTLGHSLGDHVLRESAKRMGSSVRHDDTVARLGGDEFLILLDNLDSLERIQVVTERLLSSFKEPITLKDHEFVVTVSIGISVAPTDGINAAQLLRNADLAMYQSKRKGKNTYHYFTKELSLDLERRHSIEKCLLNAISNNEFLVVYQPIVHVNDLTLRGAEALLRWNSKELGAVDVSELIAIAEQIGFIHSIGEYVLDQALGFAQNFKNKNNNNFRISINVSPIQILERNFVDIVKKYLVKYNLPGKILEIEITEGVLLKRNIFLDTTMEEIRKLGVSIAIDDFGTGYAAIGYLREFSFDCLKIDRSLISDLSTKQDARELVKACIHLSRGLGLRSIAEGVETVDQMEFLRANKCDLAQGFLVSHPISEKEFESLFI